MTRTRPQRTRTRANGDGDAYRTADGSWRASYYVDLPDGTRKRRYVRGATKTEARQRRDRQRAAAERGELPVGATRGGTLGDWMDEWLTSKRGALADTTWLQYEREARLHILPSIGGIKLTALRPSHVRRLLGELEERGLGAQTQRHVYNRLHAALKDAVADGLVARNVCADVAAPKVRPSDAPETFTEHELHRVFAAATDEPLQPLFLLALRTGLRAGELLGLRWADVDLSTPCLHVRQVRRKTGTFAPPKSEASRRTIPLTADVVALLGRHRSQQAEARMASHHWVDLDLVFTTRQGRPLAHGNVHTVWRRVQQRAGLPSDQQRGLHALRKAFTNSLVHSGVSVTEAQRLLGHAKSELTLRVYATTDSMRLAEAMERSRAALVGVG